MDAPGMTYQTLHVFDNLTVWKIVLFLLGACVIGYALVKGTIWVISKVSGERK